MAHKYNISEGGLEFIKAYEGFRPVETVLASGQKVIGYGHPYIRGEAALLTHKKAEEILKSDLEPIETIINHIVFAPISQNQFDALVSLAFNIGIDDLADSSVLHYLNNGQPLAAAAGFDEWRKSIIAGQTYVIDALVRRRTAEKALFLSPESGVIAAPRYELPVLHDSTVSIDESDIEFFGVPAADSFVVQAPYEDEPVQEHRSEDAPSGGLMMSERAAAPQIFEDVLDADLVGDTDIEAGADAEGDSGDYSIEDVVINNVVEMRPESESESEVVAETEPPKEEGLSPIALAAADVSERLESLMEKTAIDIEAKTEIEVQADESAVPENMELNAANEDALTQAATTIVEPVIFAPEIAETEMSEPETTETESEIKPEQSALEVTPDETGTGVGAFWTTLVIGLILIGASLWQMKFSPIANLGEMGEFLAPVVLLVGAMMIMGGMFYMLKAQLRDT